MNDYSRPAILRDLPPLYPDVEARHALETQAICAAYIPEEVIMSLFADDELI